MSTMNEEAGVKSSDETLNDDESKSRSDYATGSSKTPAERLEELRKELVEQETNLKVSVEENKSTKADIAALDKIVKDFPKILDAYEKARQKLEDDKRDKQNYEDNKKPMIGVAVQEKEAEIKKEIEDRKKEVDDCETNLNDKEKAWENAQKALETAMKDLATKTEEFEKVKTRQKLIEDNLKTLAGLRDEIEKRESESQYAVMYYVMNYEFVPTLDGTPEAIAKAELETEINEAWAAMDTALSTVREKEKEKNTAEEEYKAKKDDCKQLKDSLRARIIDKLATIKC